jgi:glycosyltransferase involved in cell wall biosynthesis
MKLSIVVPVFNEGENVAALCRGIMDVMRDLQCDFELLFIDDGSLDDSFSIIQHLHRQDARVCGVRLSKNFGHQFALTAGTDFASGDAVIHMDADLQHPPNLIKTMVALWQEGYEIVYAIREVSSAALSMKTTFTRCFYSLFQWICKVPLPPNAPDFRLLDRKVVSALAHARERVRFLRGLTVWVGFRSIGIPFKTAPRRGGTVKYTWRKMMQLAIDGIVSFSSAPLYVAVYAGFLLAFGGFIYAGYALYARVFTSWTLPGWTSLLILTALIGGLQLMLLGVVGVYIGTIYEEVKQRPLYLVQSHIGFEPSTFQQS